MDQIARMIGVLLGFFALVVTTVLMGIAVIALFQDLFGRGRR